MTFSVEKREDSGTDYRLVVDIPMQREEKQVSEDREQTSGEDRAANIKDVEAHNLPGQQAGVNTGQNTPAADDDDEPDFEGHTLIGANTAEPADTNIAVNTGEPTDANV